MRQVAFYKLFGTVLKLVFITIALVSCKKQSSEATTQSYQEEMTSSKGGPNPTYTEVPLRMSVNDAGENKITSDGLGDFINGTQNVRVVFDKNGNFVFTTRASNNPNVPMTRWLNYNFNHPISPNPLLTGMESGSSIICGKSVLNSSYTPLQNLGIGATQCIGYCGGLINYDPKAVNFHSHWEDINNTPTAFAYITRISQTQWIMSPVPPGSGCSSISSVAAFVTNSGGMRWYYNMPFYFTLTSL